MRVPRCLSVVEESGSSRISDSNSKLQTTNYQLQTTNYKHTTHYKLLVAHRRFSKARSRWEKELSRISQRQSVFRSLHCALRAPPRLRASSGATRPASSAQNVTLQLHSPRDIRNKSTNGPFIQQNEAASHQDRKESPQRCHFATRTESSLSAVYHG